MVEIDRQTAPSTLRTAAFDRTQAAIRLQSAVALLEFAELLKSVPKESQLVVRQFSRDLKPLLPDTPWSDPFAELDKWEQQESDIQPATFESPAE
jgi:hypothetical protein